MEIWSKSGAQSTLNLRATSSKERHKRKFVGKHPHVKIAEALDRVFRGRSSIAPYHKHCAAIRKDRISG